MMPSFARTTMKDRRMRRGWVAAAALALGMLPARPAHAQWVRVHEQFYLPASHNWVFRRNYPAADKLFNAFDYGHAILYERLYRNPDAPVSDLEQKEYDYITRRLLVHPPRVPLEEGAIEVAYVQIAPEAKAMFEWAHLLHRQIYDVLSDERMSQADRDREIAALIRYYRSRPDVAFSSTPKNMELMEGQPYSTVFRNRYPKFNGLIWGYHWLQVGLYEPLMTGRTPDERQSGVAAAVTRFRQMLVNAPENMPRLMPMTAAIAPTFAERYPEAAIIFDNLHAMHDVISDILASPQVPRERKRAEILRAAERYRDATSFAMTEGEWREMAAMMGVQNMGGPVTGFVEAFPAPTVERGATMAQAMAGMQHGQAQGGHAGMNHGAEPAGAGHGGMQHGEPAADQDGDMARMMAMHGRMMADPVIRERIAADPVLSRMMAEMHTDSGMAGMAHGAVLGAAADERARALDFAVRLLSDPAVQARVHSDPELHRLWSDPEVQRRLRELREAPAAPAHQHH
jgi:hypothetical protein